MKNKIINYVRSNRNRLASVSLVVGSFMLFIVIATYNITPWEGWNKGGNILIDLILLGSVTVPLVASSVLYQKED